MLPWHRMVREDTATAPLVRGWILRMTTDGVSVAPDDRPADVITCDVLHTGEGTVRSLCEGDSVLVLMPSTDGQRGVILGRLQAQLGATEAFRRRIFSTRRSLLTAATLVLGLHGSMGASVAWQLRRLGLSVHIVERAGEPATGSTARATGGFRAQYASAINVQLSLLSLELLSHFQKDTGADAEYRPVGYLFLILGVILIAFGLGSDSAIYARHSLGININLLWGACLALFGTVMLLLVKRSRG